MQVHFFRQLADLPSAADALWDSAAKRSVFFSRWWFETLIEASLDQGDDVAIGVFEDLGQPVALLPCRWVSQSQWLGSRRLQSLTGPYSCLFRPMVADSVHEQGVVHELGKALGGALRSSDSIWLDAMDGDWPGFDDFEAGLRESGFVSVRYDHFGNWSESLSGRSYGEYVSSRSGALQEIIRRKGRALTRQGAEFQIVSAPDEITGGIAQYESVYGRSWKVAEPHPNFPAALLRNAAAHDALRLGICRIGGKPAAVQLWTVWNGTATVMKLAHDEAFARFSVGTILMAHMIRHLMESDSVIEMDFGRGDDAYKRLWSSRRRQRVGLIAANPHSVAGSFLLAREALPIALRVLKRLPRRRRSWAHSKQPL